jgi:hypothetical protein
MLDISSASRSGTLGFAKHTEIFQSKDVASEQQRSVKEMLTQGFF